MVKAVDVFNTKYLYRTFVVDLVNYVNANAPVEMDFAGARITTDFADAIHSCSASGKLIPCDTEDAERNAVFQHNMNAFKIHDYIESKQHTDIMCPSDPNNMNIYFNYDYGTNRIITVPYSDEIYCLWAILLSMHRPELEIAPGECLKNIIYSFHTTVPKEWLVGRNVYYFDKYGALCTQENVDADFLRYHYCMPVEIGTKPLLNDPDYKPAVMAILARYNEILSPKYFTIADYIRR